jgi:hypothetical protein
MLIQCTTYRCPHEHTSSVKQSYRRRQVEHCGDRRVLICVSAAGGCTVIHCGRQRKRSTSHDNVVHMPCSSLVPVSVASEGQLTVLLHEHSLCGFPIVIFEQGTRYRSCLCRSSWTGTRDTQELNRSIDCRCWTWFHSSGLFPVRKSCTAAVDRQESSSV